MGHGLRWQVSGWEMDLAGPWAPVIPTPRNVRKCSSRKVRSREFRLPVNQSLSIQESSLCMHATCMDAGMVECQTLGQLSSVPT